MKLAEALQIRSDLQVKINELRERLLKNATFQEGEHPVENPYDLLKELDSTSEQLASYIFRINLTNSITKTPKGTLMEVLAKREVLKQKRSIYQSFVQEAASITPRYGRMEIKVFSAVSVPELQKEIDLIAKELRQIELIIQEYNWLTEVIS